MAYDEGAARRVRAALAGQAGITEKKMMGALCFMAKGKMCCGVTGAALMVRVARDAFDEALAQAHVRPLQLGGRRARGFVLIDPPGYRGAAALRRWTRRGLDVAAGLPAKRSGLRKPRRPKR